MIRPWGGFTKCHSLQLLNTWAGLDQLQEMKIHLLTRRTSLLRVPAARAMPHSTERRLCQGVSRDVSPADKFSNGLSGGTYVLAAKSIGRCGPFELIIGRCCVNKVGNMCPPCQVPGMDSLHPCHIVLGLLQSLDKN